MQETITHGLLLLLSIASLVLHAIRRPWAQRAAAEVDELEKDVPRSAQGGFAAASLVASLTVVGVFATLCAFVLAVGGCGSTQKRTAIKHAELTCIEQAKASLVQKLMTQQPTTKAQMAAIALEITGQELACALVALGAQPAVTLEPPAPAPDAGVEMPPATIDAGSGSP